MNSAPASAARTIVSLTFDDGLNQSQVLDMLLFHSMKGTFYVNSNLIGTGGGYLSKAELDALQSAGNEIGGHTINHVDLATLSDAEQQAAICDDMQTLNNWYPGQIHSFAYPFASTGPTTQSIVAAGCPGVGTYTNARTVGGLVSGNQCTSCPTAETIPPGNPYYILTPESILSTTTLNEIKTLVTQAENNGGGWVPLVFHNVCNGCDLYSVTQANLDAFLTWLQPREANGTYVRTVNQVMTGDIPPPSGFDTTPPTVSITAPAAGSTVSGTITVAANASDNVGVAGVQFKLDGVNLGSEDTTAPYSISWNTASASSGTHTLTAVARDTSNNVTTSAAVTVTVNNADTTVPTVSLTAPTAGSTVSGTITVSANASDNVGVVGVQFKLDGNNLGSEDTAAPYTISWNTTTANNGTHTLTAVARDAAGNVTTSAAVTVTVNNADTTAPTVSITAPTAGSTVSGSIMVSANAADNVGVVGVQFKLDGVNLGSEDTTTPYSVTWNTTTATNGTHSLTAVARDAAGNTTTSAAVTVTVNNADTTAPTISITAPAAGSTVSGTITVSANAADNVGVVGVQFKLDGVNLGTEDTTSPYAISWNTTTAANGTHSLTAVARDAAGNATTSATVTVTVNNADTTAPTVSITAPAAGTVSGIVAVSANAADNIGVVGVLFKLDGNDLGTEVTTAPYAISWNTTTATNGNHNLTAIARDAAGNATTSAIVTVTVNNADTTAPTVSITAPAAGTVSSTITVMANAADNVGVVGVQFKLDGSNLGAEDTTAPYSTSWNTTTVANGTHTLTAVARDAAGNVTTSAAVTVTVNNADTTAPTVSITAPSAGSTVTGTIIVSASAADNVGVAGVQFKLDEVTLGSEATTSPYSISWNTAMATNGTHTLTAVARDAAGNTTTSSTVSVTVNNTVAVNNNSGGKSGGGSLGLLELVSMLIVATVVAARNKSEKSDKSLSLFVHILQRGRRC